MFSVALDIGTYSIKAVAAKLKRDQIQIERYLELPNPIGLSVPTEETVKEKMAQVIEALFSDNSLSTDDVRLALPESVVSTKVIEIPSLTDAELASAIGWQAEQFIPIPKDELSLEYQVLYRPDKAHKDEPMRVLLIGARKSLIDHFASIFTLVGIEPKFIETQTLSLIRHLELKTDDPVSLIAQIGFSTMDISITHHGELAFVFSHPQAGMLLTRAVENVLSLPSQQAEEYKRSYGLDQQYFEAKVQKALDPLVRNMISQIVKAGQYYSSQFPQSSIERIFLSGGTAQLPGLLPLAASMLNKEVLMLNPFVHSSGVLPEANQSSFAVCMGLLERQN